MKAYNLHGINKLIYEDITYPKVGDGWCVVKVKAAGICSSDIPRIYTKGTYHFPTVPGHEFSGIVDKVAYSKDSHWLNKRVGIFPLIPCEKCDQCKLSHYEMCDDYDYLGSRRDGGFSEYVAVPVWNLIELPNSVSFIESALLEPLSVALHAIKLCDIHQGKSVAIVGTGMIGIAAAQWAIMKGASNVTIIGRNEEKRRLISSLKGIKYSVNEYIQADVVLEAVGTPDSIDTAINCAKPAGTIVLMGNPSGDISLSQSTYWRILRKQLTLKGTWNSTYKNGNESDWKEAIDAIASKSIDVKPLVSHVYKQDQLIEGLELIKQHNEPYCKVMTVWN